MCYKLKKDMANISKGHVLSILIDWNLNNILLKHLCTDALKITQLPWTLNLFCNNICNILTFVAYLNEAYFVDFKLINAIVH